MLTVILTVLGALAVSVITSAIIAPTRKSGSSPNHGEWP